MYDLSMRYCYPLALFLLGITILCPAQDNKSSAPISLVTPSGHGRIVLPSMPEMPLELIAAYDQGQRPVAQFADKSGLAASYILFHNLSGDPSGRDCREDVIGPLLHRFDSSISKLKKSEMAKSDVAAPATAAYFIESMDGHPFGNRISLALWETPAHV